MGTISKLATRRLKFNRSRSVLTAIALALTTALLTALGSAAIGLVDFQQKTIAYDTGNTHATLLGLSIQQLRELEQNEAVEALVHKESFASIIHGNLNAALNYTHVVREGIQQIALTEGRMPESPLEIAGPPSLFERLDAEPVVGGTVVVPFRVQGEGEIITRDFTIVGLQEQADLSLLDVSDSRLAFAATISQELIQQYLDDSQRVVSAQIRVDESLPQAEIEALIHAVAADVGAGESDISVNSVYLMWMTEPDNESAVAIVGLGLLVSVLGGLVIYNIYYVSVISSIQELGKLKALGATRKQMKRLLLTEGLALAAASIPVGLALGYGCAHGLFAFMRASVGRNVGAISIFSLPVLLAVILAVLATTYLSLRTPMNMAAKISPVEAMRYQEPGGDSDGRRKGHHTISLLRLSLANLSRNKRRTAATIVTMGLTCVLFLAIATVLCNINVEDYARQTLRKGEFMLQLQYSLNDAAYPENNLDAIQANSPFGVEALEGIAAIPGVTGVEARGAASVTVNHPSFEPGERISIGGFSREDVPDLQLDTRRGEIDYDGMMEQTGIIFTWDAFFDEYGFAIGDVIPLTFHNGAQETQVDAVLVASTVTSRNEFWMPEERLAELLPGQNLTETLYIHVREDTYAHAKDQLREIEEEHTSLSLYSLDEEIRIAQSSLRSLKAPIYGLLLIVGVISFMSLINTMITSILTRKRELGILQAIGLSDSQLRRMLQNEGLVVTVGSLLCGLVVGNLLGWVMVWIAVATDFITVRNYHYPWLETLILFAAFMLGQLCVTLFISKFIHKESLVSRMRNIG